MTTITREQFDALRPSNPDLVVIERDGEYAYEVITDYDGREIAFATWRGGEAVSFQKAD